MYYDLLIYNRETDDIVLFNSSILKCIWIKRESSRIVK